MRQIKEAQIKEALLTSFEVVACGALLLVLPCVMAELIFGCFLTEILAQVMLVAVAGTAILTTIAVHEGWYFEHSSDLGLARDHGEPILSAEPPSTQGADGDQTRSG